MSMFNECLIHLCDCTCLNVLHILNSMLIKQKNIFECFNCFWKIFLFWKIFKNFKNYAALFWRLASWVKPVASLLRRFSRPSGKSNPSHEKDLELFSKIWVFRFLATQFGDLFVSGSSNHKGYLEGFAAPFVTDSRVELPIAKNT